MGPDAAVIQRPCAGALVETSRRHRVSPLVHDRVFPCPAATRRTWRTVASWAGPVHGFSHLLFDRPIFFRPDQMSLSSLDSLRNQLWRGGMQTDSIRIFE